MDVPPTPTVAVETVRLEELRLLAIESRIDTYMRCHEDYTALASGYPAPPASAGIVWNGDWGQLSEAAFLRDFAGDLPAAKARALYAVQGPFQRSLLAGKTTQAAWRSKPSYYAVSTQDRTINPDLERFMARRMGAKTIEVNASHLSLISQPATIAGLILEAAGRV